MECALKAPAGEVWAGAVTEAGIRDEMRPILRMTMPPGLRGLTIDDVPVGEPLGRSWLLLFGLIPVDYDDFTLAERGPGFRFLERSRMLSLSSWQHERRVEAAGEGCLLRDRLTFELRRPLRSVPGFARLAEALVSRFFGHRHRRLVARYGAAVGSAAP